MEALWRDIRFGARALVRSPGFTLAAVLTLTLGIGGNTGMFRMVDFLVLNPLPWEHPETIVSLSELNLRLDASRRWVSTAKYPEWRGQTRSFEGLAASRFRLVNLTDIDQLDVVPGAEVTPNAFALLGIRPGLGRAFLAEEAEPGSPPVAVLSHRMWKQRFGEDPAIVGRSIEIDGEAVTVVGVLSEAEFLPWPGTELVTPLRMSTADLSRTDHMLNVLGRLGPGVSLSQAQSEMDVVAQRLADKYPETDAGWTIRVEYTRDNFFGDANRSAAIFVMGAVGIVLLIACANIANLQLARGAARRKEIAIRSALGASRGQIVRQLLVESVLLSLIAFPFSMLLAQWFLDWITSLSPPSITWAEESYQVNLRTVWFAVGLSFSSIALFGLTPALRASKTDLTSDLKQGGERGSRGVGGQRLRSSLVVAQIALSLGLTVSAGLVIQRSIRLQSVDAGFPTENLLTAHFELAEQRYPEADHWKSFQRELLGRLTALPGVKSASIANSVPFGGPNQFRDFRIRGKPLGPEDEVPLALWSNVSKGYFETLGLRLLRGRTFVESDRESSVPVVIVNEALARRYFGTESPLGGYVMFEEGEVRQIVGVVSNVSQLRDFPGTDLHLYEPYAQRPSANMTVVLRTGGPPLSLGAALRREVRSSDPLLPVFNMQSMTQRVEDSLAFSHILTNVMTALAGLALVLSTVGVYGVVSYATSRRTSEFGIRAALGAAPRTIARLVLRQAAVLAAWGVSIGLLLALGLARLLSAAVYDMEAFDPVAFLVLSLLLTGVALVASTVPALRAARADPAVALQAE